MTSRAVATGGKVQPAADDLHLGDHRADHAMGGDDGVDAED